MSRSVIMLMSMFYLCACIMFNVQVVSCFCVNGELVPWFHGLLSRAEADRVLANHIPLNTNNCSPAASPAASISDSGSPDGTFLIRFSESHPTKFTLSYIKIHTAPPYTGRREMKNCLIENLGLSQQQSGESYVLTDSRTRGYSSILSFVQRSAGKLKHGVPSLVAKHCNSELAEIRALQDQQSNSYTAFSAETFDMAENASLGGAAANRSLLFAPSSPALSPSVKQLQSSGGSSTGSSDCCADSYSGFTLDALTTAPSSVLPAKTNPMTLSAGRSPTQQSPAPQSDDDYGVASHFFSEAQASKNNQQSHNAPPVLLVKAPPPPSAVDENADYGNFMSFAAAASSGALSSPVAAARFGNRLLSPSSSRFPQQQQMGVMQLSPSRLRHLQQGGLSPSNRAAMLAKKQQQEDAYGTFESFASSYAAQSEQLAQKNRVAISFSKMNVLSSSSSSCASTVSLGSSMGCDDPYGSFASVSITKPVTTSTTNTFATTSSSDKIEEPGYGAADYGNFASLGGFGVEGTSRQQQLDDEFSLGPPPPPQTSRFQLKTESSEASDAYGSFASLLASSENQQEDNSDDVYGQFQFEAKVKQPSVLARANASQDDQLKDTQQQQANDEEEPVHAHSDACSALEELNAGMAFYREKQLDAALLRFIHAREVALVTDNKVVEARALGNLGTVYLDKKNPQQAVVCYQRCLDITRSIKDTKRERTILNNLVLALMASEDFERALACCQVQLEMTTNEINRRKIFSRMSLLREKAARASRGRASAGAFAASTQTA